MHPLTCLFHSWLEIIRPRGAPWRGRLLAACAAWLLALPALAQPVEDQVLPVDQAFAVSASGHDDSALTLRFAIAPGYYLYRDKIRLRALDDGLILGQPELAAAATINDEFFGEMAIYRDATEVRVPIIGLDPSRPTLELEVGLQGCHENDPRICYPPHRVRLSLARTVSPSSSVADSAAPTAAAPPLGDVIGNAQAGAIDLLGAQAGANWLGNDRTPLPEAEAFRFEAIVSASDRGLRARFSMPPGYYLYRDRTSFTLIADPELRSAEPAWPAAVDIEDAHFGAMAVYFNQVEVPLAFTAAVDPAQPRAATLIVAFQGCQENGICYPPMRREVRLDLPAPNVLAPGIAALSVAESRATAPAESQPVQGSESDRLASALREGNRVWVLLVFFALGLGLAFTPCVLPMVPILSGIIAGVHGITPQRAAFLSAVYVLATALVFTAAGVIAGVAGQNLQAALQKPAVLIAFAGVFVALALSMFGFYELKPPNWLMQRIGRLNQHTAGGSVAGVALMGVLSALLVGPCVAPPLAGAVLYIGQQQDPVFGGAALFALALGMGVPLIAFGASAGRILPKIGPWMRRVNQFFGVIFLGLALWMLERVLDPVWIMLGLGLLLTASGVHMGALERLAEPVSGWRRTWKALGFALLVLGVLQFIGVASGGRDWLRPLSALSAATGSGAATPLRFALVDDAEQLDRALADAAAAKRPLLFDFYADWCIECKRMERNTFSDPQVAAALAGFTLVKVDVTDQNEAHRALQQRFAIIGPPATLFFSCSADENRAVRLIGYEDATPFAARVTQARACVEPL